MVTLDVGSYIFQNGDVNVNLWKVPAKKPGADFVRCDLNCGLPFVDGCFRNVFCYHVLEHILNPYFLLDELLGFSSFYVEIRGPWRFSGYAKNRGHLHFFNGSWFKKVLEKKNVKFLSSYLNLDTRHSIWSFPLEVVVRIYK